MEPLNTSHRTQSETQNHAHKKKSSWQSFVHFLNRLTQLFSSENNKKIHHAHLSSDQALTPALNIISSSSTAKNVKKEISNREKRAKEQHRQDRIQLKQATRISCFKAILDKLDTARANKKKHPNKWKKIDTAYRENPELNKKNSIKIHKSLNKLENVIRKFDLSKHDALSKKEYSKINSRIRLILTEITASKAFIELEGKGASSIEFIEDLALSLYLQGFNLEKRHAKTSFIESQAMGDFAKRLFLNAEKNGSSDLKKDLEQLKEKFNDLKGTNSDLADLVKKLVVFSGQASWSAEDSYLAFIIHHPERAACSSRSMIDSKDIPYNTLNEGNPIQPLSKITVSTIVHNRKIERKIAHVCAGSPTEAGKLSPIAKAAIRAMERKGIRWLDVNLQGTSGAEGKRSQALIKAGQTDKVNTFTAHSDTVDGKVFETGKGLISKEDFSKGKFDTAAFAKSFEGYVTKEIDTYKINGNGYYLSGENPEEKIKKAIKKTEELLHEAVSEPDHFFADLPVQKKSRLFQFTFQVIKNIGEMVEHALKGNPLQEDFFTDRIIDLMYMEHCKQDIDRGAIKNVISTYLIELLADNPIDCNRILEIISPILGRAQSAQDRAILLHRLDPLLDLLRAIPQDKLKKGMTEHLDNLGYAGVSLKSELLTSSPLSV